MKVKFITVIKAWLIAAGIGATINLIWFFINTAKNGNPWADVIGVVPILVMSFSTILVGSLVYWGLNLKLKKADLIFKIGAIVVMILSVMGHPKLSNGTLVPPEFRIVDMPMHFVVGLLCAFLVPAICRGKIFASKKYKPLHHP